MPSWGSAPRNGQAPDRSGLPEALPTFGAALGAIEPDIIEFAVIQRREAPARTEAMMPQRQHEQDAMTGTPPARFAGKSGDAKNDVHEPTMPPVEGSALRRMSKCLLE